MVKFMPWLLYAWQRTLVSTEKQMGGPVELVWMLWRRYNILSWLGFTLQIVHPKA
jgi:hypothetical protein